MRANLNMPAGLPLWGDKRDYDMDAPITVLGNTQARIVGTSPAAWFDDQIDLQQPPYLQQTFLLVGEALLESNTVIDFVYCSPSLRCVQTAQNILKGESRQVSFNFLQVSILLQEGCLIRSFSSMQVCSRMAD